MDKIAVVVINGATREFDKQYHYSVPRNLEDKVLPGIRVIVPFGKGNSTKEGYVLGFAEKGEYTNLKEIKKVIDEKPLLMPSLIDLAIWMKKRYFCTYGAAIKCMLPAGTGIKALRVVKLLNSVKGLSPSKQSIVDTLESNENMLEADELKQLTGIKSRFNSHLKELEAEGIIKVSEQYSMTVKQKSIRAASLAVSDREVADDIESGKIKRIQHIRVLEILLENEYVAVQDLVRFASVSPGVLDTLRKLGYIYYKDIEVKRDPLKHRHVEASLPLEPTKEQEAVLREVVAAVDSGKFQEMLLHGVTGSGKTEVYLQLIQYIINKGKQAIVLVPEISLTPQMVDRFRSRFGNLVAVLHSRLSPGERYDQWRLIRNGDVKIAVGARSAVFAPFSKLGAIIIDEEHDSSYKSETTPKYSALQIAAKRCMYDGALLLYGSATPSVDTYKRAVDGEIGLLTLNSRANALVLPKVEVVDMRTELESGNRTIFSKRLYDEISQNIKSGQQTILFLNKRGYASFVLCRNCGIRLKCRYCNITMTYHSSENRLICHYCGYTEKMPAVCPKCGSSSIRQFGTGTQKVEEELKKYFPGCSVLRMDMDTTTGKHSHEEILDTFREKQINILVGTQMIAKGHDFPNVTLVGVLAADSILGMDDFRASERTFQLITQVAGRAGRGHLPGRVIIQTYNTEDYSITSACRHDYHSFFMQEIDVRKRLRYPPYTNIGCIIVSSSNDRLAFEKANELYKFIKTLIFNEGCELMPGPLRAPLSKLRGKYRWRIVLKCKSEDRLSEIFCAVYDEFYSKRGRNDIELNMDINPQNMM